ncbi:hypothetical protein 1 [Hubei toti-like virus 16]|uniref:hypothetical protein 1 n=1 Tax=Hubei toti-like virus 16 TaxID=1923304 RepID=UPI0009098C5C|nr:hypothetical protein 1 [Hubei toti-like virus 16]APG76031.1 hypothetical protein 1 [Hubei toti-like virus 16]
MTDGLPGAVGDSGSSGSGFRRFDSFGIGSGQEGDRGRSTGGSTDRTTYFYDRRPDGSVKYTELEPATTIRVDGIKDSYGSGSNSLLFAGSSRTSLSSGVFESTFGQLAFGSARPLRPLTDAQRRSGVVTIERNATPSTVHRPDGHHQGSRRSRLSRFDPLYKPTRNKRSDAGSAAARDESGILARIAAGVASNFSKSASPRYEPRSPTGSDNEFDIIDDPRDESARSASADQQTSG